METHYAISSLARRFGLSRSALLHYDRIGLLRPSCRSPAGYRRYSEADAERLHRILIYRHAGVALQKIGRLLENASVSATRSTLLAHLDELNRQADELRAQRGRVLSLLGSSCLPDTARLLSREAMVTVFRAAGLDDDGMQRLHAHFERVDPEAHQRFLESLGLDAGQIATLRQLSRR